MAVSLRFVHINCLPRFSRAVSSLSSSRYLNPSNVHDAAVVESPSNLTNSQKSMLDSAIRIDQAGEIAANWIYKGQLAVLGRDPKVGPLIEVCFRPTHLNLCLMRYKL